MPRLQPPCTSPSSLGIGCPVRNYGGTQRIVVYLARGLAAAGHRVTLLAGAGSDVPEADAGAVGAAAASPARPGPSPAAPRGHRDCCCRSRPSRIRPTCPGSAACTATATRRGERAQHALPQPQPRRAPRGDGIRLQWDRPGEFRFQPVKSDYDLFLGRLHRVKGYRWAIEGARRSEASAAAGGRMAALVDAGGAVRGSGRRRAEGRPAGRRRLPLDAGAAGTSRSGSRWSRRSRAARRCSAPGAGALPEIVSPDSRGAGRHAGRAGAPGATISTGSTPRRAAHGSSGTSLIT